MSYIDIYRQLQKQIMEPYKLCEIDVETITPLLIGGYDGRTYHGDTLGSESLRVTSVKGVWRWWARALIAAAMVKKLGRCPRYINVVDSYVSKIFGSTQEQSKYSIVVTPHMLNESSYDVIEKLSKVPRVSLLKMRKETKGERFIKPGIKFKITVYRTRDTNPIEDQFAVWALITSLIFDGVGKITSRGFGKVKINRIDGRSDLRELEEARRKLYSSNNHEEVENCLKGIIENAVDKAEKVREAIGIEINDEDWSALSTHFIEVPLINNGLMILEVPSKLFKEYRAALEAIGNASLKLYHKVIKYVKERMNVSEAKQKAYRESGKDIHTWILGLPRSQELRIPVDRSECSKKVKELKEKLESELSKLNLTSKDLVEKVKPNEKEAKIEVPTGYYILDKDIKSRRRSPIRFTVIKTNSGYFTVIYAFKTFDWEKKIDRLIHVSFHHDKEKPFEVTLVKTKAPPIDDVINTVVCYAKEIIENI